MTNKHTPGPWDIEVEECRTFITGEGRQLAKILLTHANNDEYSEHLVRAKANVRLIAAAPDMLAALEKLLNALPSATTHPAIKTARTAIAKAKGD